MKRRRIEEGGDDSYETGGDLLPIFVETDEELARRLQEEFGLSGLIYNFVSVVSSPSLTKNKMLLNESLEASSRPVTMQTDLEQGSWKCGQCTFINKVGRVAGGADTCEVCNASINEGVLWSAGTEGSSSSIKSKPKQDDDDKKPNAKPATEWVCY